MGEGPPKPPRVTSLRLCDRVEQDEALRNFSILGTVTVLMTADLSVPLPAPDFVTSVERGTWTSGNFVLSW